MTIETEYNSIIWLEIIVTNSQKEIWPMTNLFFSFLSVHGAIYKFWKACPAIARSLREAGKFGH